MSKKTIKCQNIDILKISPFSNTKFQRQYSAPITRLLRETQKQNHDPSPARACSSLYEESSRYEDGVASSSSAQKSDGRHSLFVENGTVTTFNLISNSNFELHSKFSPFSALVWPINILRFFIVRSWKFWSRYKVNYTLKYIGFFEAKIGTKVHRYYRVCFRFYFLFHRNLRVTSRW